MPEDKNIEDIVNEAKQPQDQASENTIDDKVKETGKRNFYKKSFFGKLFDYTIGASATVGAAVLMGPIALIGPVTSVLGDYIVNRKRGKKLSSRQVRDDLIIGSLMSIPAMFGFNLMNKYIPMGSLAGKITRAVVQTGPFYLTLSAIGYPLDYIIRPYKNKSLSNFSQKLIRPYFKKNWWDGAKYFTIPEQFAANFLPPILHYPVSTLLGLTYRTTIGQRILKGLDPYDINSNGNGADREKKSDYKKNSQLNYG